MSKQLHLLPINSQQIDDICSLNFQNAMPFNTGNIILRYFGRSNLTVVYVLDYVTLM